MSTEMLSGHSAQEKTAYLSAIASIATADNVASDDEVEYLMNLADYAGLSDEDKEKVTDAAKDTTTDSLKQSLDVLKGSELKYSLVADLIAFANADSNLADSEKKQITGIAKYLGVNETQVDALHDFVKEATNQQAATPVGAMEDASTGGAHGFLDNLGIGNKLQNAGINLGSLGKGLLAFIGPMLAGGLLSRLMRGRSGGGGGLGGALGGGLGGALGGGLGQGGGLGSILGGLTSGRGLSGIGGFLSKLL